MILPSQKILELGPSMIKPFNPNNVNPASYDVTLSEDVIIRDGEKYKLPSTGLKLLPNEFIIASTIEYFNFPDYLAGDLKLKSTIGRMGLNHALSGWFDPGFSGNGTLELQNISGKPLILYPNIKIAQMIFMMLTEPTILSYKKTGRYVGQVGPTLARDERIDKFIIAKPTNINAQGIPLNSEIGKATTQTQ